MIDAASSLLKRYRHGVIVTLLCAVALVVTWFLLPDDDTRIAALERDGQLAAARELLVQKFEQGDRRPRTLYQLHRIHEYFGDLDNARKVLELLAQMEPKDANVQRRLARLYNLVQDETAYIGALKAQLRIRHSDRICRDLIGHLRRTDDADGEAQAISACRINGYRRPDDLSRLATLHAVNGNMIESAAILRSIDDRRWLKELSDRLLLFTALVEAKQPDEAYRRGVRWLKGQADNDLALQLISLFVEANHKGHGIELAKAVGQPGDTVSLAVGEIMVDQVQYPAARAFLNGWLEKAKALDTETATRFMQAAIDSGDPGLALKGAMRHGLEKFAQADLVALCEAMVTNSEAAAFDSIYEFLTPETLALNPMLLAEAELRRGRVDLARLHLTRVRAEELDERRLELLASLSDRAGRPPAVAAVLRELRVVAASPAIGPAQAQVNRIVRQQSAAKRISKQRRRIARPIPGGTAQAPGAPAIQPIPFPSAGGG